MLKMSMSRIEELYKALSAQQSLYLPIEKNDKVDFWRWAEGENVRLNVQNTNKSPKNLFFPQVENMVAFNVEGKSIEIIQQELSQEKFVLLGVRACDVRAFAVLDKVFLADPVDTFYAARRENGVIVTLACSKPAQSCFCQTFGIDAANPADGDVVTWIVDGELYWESRTEKGAALTESVKALFAECADEAVKAEEARVQEELSKLPFAGLSLEGFDGDHMKELFARPEWESLSEACLGCGTCTFTCPTCQCYDIRDYDTGHGVQRFRCWDSCMYSDFTMMAAATNRPTQMQRFRQRFMHKLVYYPMNNDGMYSCVGCGRCVQKCPIHMNIVKVMKTLGGQKK